MSAIAREMPRLSGFSKINGKQISKNSVDQTGLLNAKSTCDAPPMLQSSAS